MATPSYEEIMGQSDAPSYEQIIGGSSRDEATRQKILNDTAYLDGGVGAVSRAQNPASDGGGTMLGSVPISQEFSELHQQALSQPILRIPQTTPEFQQSHGILAGVADTAGGVGNFLQSGEGLGLLAMPGAPALLRGAVGLGFAAQGATDAPDAMRNIASGVQQGDTYGTVMGIGQLGLDAGMLHGGLSPARFTSPADVSARRILRTPPPDVPISPPSVETAATPLVSPSTTEPTTPAEQAPNPHDYVPAINIGGETVPGLAGDTHQDVLNRWIGENPERTAEAVVGFDAPDNPNFFLEGDQPVSRDELQSTLGVRDSQGLSALQSAVEPTSSGQEQPPIAGDERTLEGGAAAPAQQQSVDSVLSVFHVEQDPIKKQALWQQANSMMESGMPLGPGKVTVGELPPQNTTGIKRVVVDTERLQRGEPEIATHRDAANDEEAVRSAEDTAYQDPSAGPALVSRINGGDAKISRQEAAMLLVERQRIINERTQWEQRAGDETADPSEKTAANQHLQQIEEQLTSIDNASRKAGAEWSGIGRMYQRMIQEDFSLDALERKARAAKGESLTPDERDKLKQQADAYQQQKEKADTLQKSLDEANAKSQADADLTRAHEQTIKEMQAQEAARPKFGKVVFDQAQKIVDRLKINADASRIKLRSALSQLTAGVDPTVIVHAANILAHKVGEFGLKKAEAFAEMVDEYGPKIEPFLEKAWKQVKKIIGAEAAPDKVKKVVKAGVKKEPTSTDAAARLKADATAGDELSHKAVYDVWRAKVREGITNVDEAAKATHEVVKQSYPEATEQQVREAFSEYGKVKFPSKEADKVTLAEHRRITQLQLSIDRLKAGLDPLKTGTQRDKATQEIRDKQKELSALLKQKAAPPSPEQLASRNDARVTSLKNQIEDLDRQLRTGEAPPKSGPPLPDSPEVERLKSERDAMKAKVEEIERESNPGPTDEERYNKKRMAQIERESKKAQVRLDTGDYGPRPVKQPKELFAATAAAHSKLEAMRQEIRAGEDEYRKANRLRSAKFSDTVNQALNIPRGLKTALHGTSFMLTHGGAVGIRMLQSPLFWSHFAEQFKLTFSPERYEQAVHRMNTDPESGTWKNAGLSIDPSDAKTDDYAMASKLFGESIGKRFGKLNEIGNRGMFALKAFRFAMAKAEWEDVPQDIKDDPVRANAHRNVIAEITNMATGTLSKGNDWLNQGARWGPLRMGLFAPRLLFSRWGRAIFDPIKTFKTLAIDGKSAPEAEIYAAKLRMKHAGQFAGKLVGALLVNQAILSSTGSNQKVNLTDPSQTDWLKFKAFGRTIKADGGLLDPLRLIGQLVLNDLLKKDSSYRHDGSFDRAGKRILNYARGVASPLVGLATDIATGSDFSGRPMPWSNEKPRFADQPKYSWGEWLISQGPLSLGEGSRDAYDSMRQQGVSQPEALQMMGNAAAWVHGLIGTAVGTTGVHESTDYRALKAAQPKGQRRIFHGGVDNPAQRRLFKTPNTP